MEGLEKWILRDGSACECEGLQQQVDLMTESAKRRECPVNVPQPPATIPVSLIRKRKNLRHEVERGSIPRREEITNFDGELRLGFLYLVAIQIFAQNRLQRTSSMFFMRNCV